MKNYRTYILLFFLTISSSLTDANPALKLSPKQWTEISKGIDYTETYTDLEKETKKSDSLKWDPLDYNFSNLKYVFYFLIIGLVIFMMVKIIRNVNKKPTIQPKTISIDSMEEIEEKMHELNLDELLQEALKANNYRIALRIHFLIIIKMLSQKGEIIWAKEKTNWEYHSEIKDKNISSLFKQIIMSFEPVWYGEHPLSEEQFNVLNPEYEHMKKQLETHE